MPDLWVRGISLRQTNHSSCVLIPARSTYIHGIAMAEANFVKLLNGSLMPAYEADREMLGKIKTGQVVKLKLTRMRNYQFFKKWWALVNFAYDFWDPSETEIPKWRGVEIEKNLDQFRTDLTILAGYSNVFHRVDGSYRVVAKSISFGSMDEDEFEKLYSATIQVVLKHICKEYTGEMLQSVVDQTLEFV